MGKFTELIAKEGETISLYVHSFESSRDSVTNLKESKWVAATDITAIVRSQPSNKVEEKYGTYDNETIVILTETAVAQYDVVKWNVQFFDVVLVEEIFWHGTRDYYKATCKRRIEFLGF